MAEKEEAGSLCNLKVGTAFIVGMLFNLENIRMGVFPSLDEGLVRLLAYCSGIAAPHDAQLNQLRGGKGLANAIEDQAVIGRPAR